MDERWKEAEMKGQGSDWYEKRCIRSQASNTIKGWNTEAYIISPKHKHDELGVSACNTAGHLRWVIVAWVR
jgi:hypothetical protein